jgi:hypothetical protein
VTHDKALLGYLLSSLTREILMGVTTLSSSTDVWRTLETMFGVPTQARSVNTRITLATTKKGTSTMAEFYSNMKGYADEMAAAGQALDNDEFVAYVLTGLDEEIYNPFVSSIVTRVEPISASELYSQMLSYKLRLEKQYAGGYNTHSSANAATRGRDAPWSRGGKPSARGRGRVRSNGRGTPSGHQCGSFTNTSSHCGGGSSSSGTGGP